MSITGHHRPAGAAIRACVFTLVLASLIAGVAAPFVQAQSTNDPWAAVPSTSSGGSASSGSVSYGSVPLGTPGHNPTQVSPLLPPIGDPTSAASRRNAHLPTVSIREFRSSMPEVGVRGAMDMFMTELIRSRKFRVLERDRLMEGVAVEKVLNMQGVTTGQASSSKYLAATYLFEATISEANIGEAQKGFGLNFMGAGVDRNKTTNAIGIDVRLVDVESGVAVDAQNVRRQIVTEVTKGGGLINALAMLSGNTTAQQIGQALPPIDFAVSARKESVDKALREAIEEAILAIAKRLPVE